MANERQKRYHKKMERVEFYVHPDLKESYVQACKSLGLSYRQVFEKGFQALGVKLVPSKKVDPNQVDIFGENPSPVQAVTEPTTPPKPKKPSTKKVVLASSAALPPKKPSTKKEPIQKVSTKKVIK